MAELPIMPMFVDAYLADTGHLTCLEHGAYDLLLKAMWRSGGFLPFDDKFLARVCRLTAGQWRRIRPTIMRFMHPVSEREFTQDKLLETIDAVRRKRKSQQDKARSRWLKKKGLADAAALSRHMPTDAIHKPNSTFLLVQSPTPTKEESGSAEKKEAREEIEVASEAFAPSSALLNTRLMQRRA